MTQEDPLGGHQESTLSEYTRPVYYRRGTYTLSAVKIPYFSGNLLADDLDKLKLVQELPLDYRESWRLDELYQRDIDESRVENDIVGGYLRNPSRIVFFNSLTVALLPRTPDGTIGADYGSPDSPPDPVPNKWKALNLGGVQICQPVAEDVRSFGYVRWNTSKVFAAVIDGQHRLAALRKFFAKDVRSEHQGTDIPIIFLVFHSDLGCNVGALDHLGSENKLLRAAREIFIDLNKHARIVSPSRRILMDDQDVESQCIRTLMAERSMERRNDVLPLGAVNWRTDSSKFEKGEHITTLLQLRTIVSDLLDLKYPPVKEDPTQKKLVKGLAESINSALQIDAIIREKRGGNIAETFEEYVDSRIIPVRRPLNVLPPQYLRLAVQGFREIWWPAILGVFRYFSPYVRVLQELEKRGGVDGEWARYNVWPEEYQTSWRNQNEDKYQEFAKHREAIQDLKQDDFCFYAVFQRAVMKATKHIAVENADMFSSSLNLRKGRVVVLDRWISLLNSLHSAGVFRRSFRMGNMHGLDDRLWVGVSQTPTGAVQWSESSANRIANLLVLWWFRAISAKDYSTTKAFLRALAERKSVKVWPGGAKSMKALHKGLFRAYKSKLKGSVPDETKLKKDAEKLADERLAALVALAEPCGFSEIRNDLVSVSEACGRLAAVMGPVQELLDVEPAPALPAATSSESEDEGDEGYDEDDDPQDAE